MHYGGYREKADTAPNLEKLTVQVGSQTGMQHELQRAIP